MGESSTAKLSTLTVKIIGARVYMYDINEPATKLIFPRPASKRC